MKGGCAAGCVRLAKFVCLHNRVMCVRVCVFVCVYVCVCAHVCMCVYVCDEFLGKEVQ
jgi:hypothetical protein